MPLSSFCIDKTIWRSYYQSPRQVIFRCGTGVEIKSKPSVLGILFFFKMASGRNSEQLTNRQIVRLAAAISIDHMTSIAEGYMNIDNETVKNIRCNEGDSEAFNRAILRYWANKHPDNQIQVGVSNFNV